MRKFSIRFGWFLSGIVVLAACSGATAMAAETEKKEAVKPMAFDIPAQPLPRALEAYGRISGASVLIDRALVAGQYSPGVKGILTDDQALRMLLAGTGLVPRYVGENAFTLEATGDPLGIPRLLSGPSRQEFRGYFADLQDSLIRILCLRKETSPGRFRLGVQLWIGPDGRVLASHLLDAADDRSRAGMIEDLLRTNPLAVPPGDLPQPVTIVLLPRASGDHSECAGGPGP